MYVCMYVCMYSIYVLLMCMHVSLLMFVDTYYVHVCVCSMYVCMYVWMYMYMYVGMYARYACK